MTGKYLCVGENYGSDPLEEPYEESWLELKKGGKGIYYSGFEFDLKWKADGEAFTGTVSLLGMEDAMEGTLKDGVIDVKYGDMNIRFVKEGVDASAAGAPRAAGAGYVPSDFFNDVQVAPTLDEAFAGAGSGDGYYTGVAWDTDFVTPTTKLTDDMRWYGYVELYNCTGSLKNETKDVWALLKNNQYGDPYFEVYDSEDFANDTPLISMWIELYDDHFVPDIGNEDAWVFDQYLTSADTSTFITYLREGALVLNCSYDDGYNTCDVYVFLREDGAPWDEEYDILPPGYEDYKAGLSA